MKALSVLGMMVGLLSFGLNAHAFSGQDQFKVELVKPWGEFGFRAIGKGRNLTEMRFDCSKVSEMGLVLSLVNQYGKTSHVVLPSGKLGKDKKHCQESLKQYFAGIYFKRGFASVAKYEQRTVELNMIRAGFFSDVQSVTSLSLR